MLGQVAGGSAAVSAGIWLLLALQLAQPSPERRAIGAHLAKDRVRVKYLRSEEVSLLKSLQQLEAAIQEHQEQVQVGIAAKAKLTEEIAALDARSAALDQELTQLKLAVAKRVLSQSRLQKMRLSALFSGHRAPGQRRRLKDWFRRVLAYDAELMGRLRRAREGREEVRQALVDEHAELEATEQALKQSLAGEQANKTERAALLAAIREERQAAVRLHRELSQAARQVDAQLGVIHGRDLAPEPVEGGFAAQKGRLPWPTAGRVELGFGKKVVADTGMVISHRGVDIRAPLVAPVRAVFPGKVVFASRMPGYGKMLVLAHPGGFYTLYAHLESFAVAAQAAVNGRQVIGHVGDSGSTKGAYLYFELRRGRTAIDPLRWLHRDR